MLLYAGLRLYHDLIFKDLHALQIAGNKTVGKCRDMSFPIENPFRNPVSCLPEKVIGITAGPAVVDHSFSVAFIAGRIIHDAGSRLVSGRITRCNIEELSCPPRSFDTHRHPAEKCNLDLIRENADALDELLPVGFPRGDVVEVLLV